MKHAIRVHIFDFLAILGLLVVALTIAVVILSEQGFRFPLVEDSPKRIEVELADAQAVEPGRGQTVRVAGVRSARSPESELEDGVAVVELDIEPAYEDMVRRTRPRCCGRKTALKDMFLEVDPGRGSVLPEGGRIGVERNGTDVDPDEILAALDADTRPYLKLLVAGAGKGLRDRGEDLNAIAAPARAAPPRPRPRHAGHRAAPRGAQAAVHSYSLLTAELGRHPADLERLVSASGEVFGALAGEDEDISTATARLPGALRQSARHARARWAASRASCGRPWRAASRRSAGSTRRNAALRPFLREHHAGPARPDQPVRARRPPVDGRPADSHRGGREGGSGPDGARSGRRTASSTSAPTTPAGPRASAGLSVTEQRAREEGFLYWLAWTAQNGVSLFNTADAQGPWRRVTICGLELGQLQPLLSFTLGAAVPESDPELLEQVSGATDGSIAPGSPVQNLLDSRFGTCDFSDLPTAP